MLGSIDANRGDYQNGWDTDQFPNSVDELSLAALRDPRRPAASPPAASTSTPSCAARASDRTDLFHAHIGGIDTLARSLLVAADMIERRTLRAAREARYAGWDGELGRRSWTARVARRRSRRGSRGEIDPRPVSGRQERLENLVNRRIWADRPDARRD